MNWPLSYREGQFSPAEAAAIAGLSLTLQRDWRSQGHLRPRTSGRAKFSPRELAEMRIMVALRSLGLSLPERRAIAEQAASSVLYMALSDYPGSLAVEAPDRGGADRGDRYLKALDRGTDGRHLNQLSGLEEAPYFYVLLQGRRGDLRYDLQEPALEPSVEASGLVNLQATAARLAEAAKRPLFTLLVPMEFK